MISYSNYIYISASDRYGVCSIRSNLHESPQFCQDFASMWIIALRLRFSSLVKLRELFLFKKLLRSFKRSFDWNASVREIRVELSCLLRLDEIIRTTDVLLPDEDIWDCGEACLGSESALNGPSSRHLV